MKKLGVNVEEIDNEIFLVGYGGHFKFNDEKEICA